jgi:uncharacterized membrane protein YqaE (UPF0057 family)
LKNNSRRRPGFLLLDAARILCAILLPPLSVFLTVGLGWPFVLNILLTLLGYVPGLVHAVWLISSRAAIADRVP